MTKLVELGNLIHMSKSGMLVVKLNPANVPKIGDKVVNRKMESVGVVQDVIGPVSSPFALVKPNKKTPKDYDVLFVVKEYGGSGEGESKGKGSRKGSRVRKKGD
ncbi:MAG: Gar1/Naf1 family protein [Archaeoglobales archaeon]|nr:Gar1/Naf1 family protein [Archaeoglobales archaeon]